MPITLTTRVEDDLARLIDEIAKREGMDRSTVIRRFLSRAARDWLVETCLKMYEEGKLTLWQATVKCGLSLWEMVSEIKKRMVHVPYGLDEFNEDSKAFE